MLLTKMHKWEQALAELNEATRLQTDFADALNAIAWLRATCPKEGLRDGKEAVEASLRACELAKWTTWYYIGTLAAAYAERGDFRQAVQRQRQALSMAGIPEKERVAMENRL